MKDGQICNLWRLRQQALYYGRRWEPIVLDVPLIIGLIEVAEAARKHLEDSPACGPAEGLTAALALFSFEEN